MGCPAFSLILLSRGDPAFCQSVQADGLGRPRGGEEGGVSVPTHP